MNYWNQHAEIPAKQIVAWLGVGGSKYFDWKKRYGKANEHNGTLPREHWLDDTERKTILDFHSKKRYCRKSTGRQKVMRWSCVIPALR